MIGLLCNWRWCDQAFQWHPEKVKVSVQTAMAFTCGARLSLSCDFKYTEGSDNLSSDHRFSLTQGCLFQTRCFWMLFSEEITSILSEIFMNIRQCFCHSAKGMYMWKWMLSPVLAKNLGTVYPSNMMLGYRKEASRFLTYFILSDFLMPWNDRWMGRR